MMQIGQVVQVLTLLKLLLLLQHLWLVPPQRGTLELFL